MGEIAGIKEKNPDIAALISAFIIGSGHIYVGKWETGIWCLVIASILTYSIFFFMQPYPLFPLSILWYWQMWDAYKMAEKFNEELLLSEKKPW